MASDIENMGDDKSLHRWIVDGVWKELPIDATNLADDFGGTPTTTIKNWGEQDITARVYHDFASDSNKGHLATDDYGEWNDKDFAFLIGQSPSSGKSMIEHWATTGQQGSAWPMPSSEDTDAYASWKKTREIVRGIMEDDGLAGIGATGRLDGGLLSLNEPTETELLFMQEVANLSTILHLNYTMLHSQLLIKKFLTDPGSITNVFTHQNVLLLEDKSLNLTTRRQAGYFDEKNFKGFTDQVMTYLQGTPSDSRKIFEAQGIQNKNCWEVPAYQGQWKPGDQALYLKGPIMGDALWEVLKVQEGHFILGATEDEKVIFKMAQTALQSVWRGGYDAANVSSETFMGFDVSWGRSITEFVGLSDSTENNYSNFTFQPINWDEVTSIPASISGDTKKRIKKIMPLTISAGDKKIDNTNGDKLTGDLTKDIAALRAADGRGGTTVNRQWSDIPELHAAFEKQATQPAAMLTDDFFKQLMVPFPTAPSAPKANAEDPDQEQVTWGFSVPGTGDTDNDPSTPNVALPGMEENAPITGDNRPSVFHAETIQGGELSFGMDLFRKFYVGYYLNMMHYNMVYSHQIHAHEDYYEQEDFFYFSAFKTAAFMAHFWTQFQHDLIQANTYAVIVAMLNNDPEPLLTFTPEDAAAFLASMEQVAEDALIDAADEIPDELLPTPNKDQREKLYKQCALLLNMHKPAMKKRQVPTATNSLHSFSEAAGFGSYNHRVHVVEAGGATVLSQPSQQTNNFINRLLSPRYDQIAPFMDITNAQYASLIPRIRLWKVYNSGGVLKETEFEFPTAPGALRKDTPGVVGLFDANFDRGDGVGLKEFNWEYDGETPATASKYIKANLSLFFQTFTDFTALRTNKKGETYRFVDLFASPFCLADKKDKIAPPHALQYDPEYYRIRIEVGYHWDPSMKIPGVDGDELRDALFYLRHSFTLVLIDNEINIQEDGTVDITANYRAYMEEAVDSFKFNALNSPDVQKERDTLQAEWEDAVAPDADGKPKCGDKQINTVRNRINGRMAILAQKQHRVIIETLLKNKRIFYVDFDSTAIEGFRKHGQFAEIPTFQAESDNQGMTIAADQSFKDWLKSQSGGPPDTFKDPADIYSDYRTYYFYLGDLIYLVTSNLYEDGHTTTQPDNWLSGAENTRVLLTDFQYYNPLVTTADTIRVMNIADIPISIDFFMKWFIENVIRAEVTSMPIGSFIRRLLIELVSEAMAEVCISSRADFYTTFSLGTLVAAGIDHNGTVMDPIQKMLHGQKTKRLDMSAVYNSTPGTTAPYGEMLPLSAVPKDGGIDKQFNYIIIYSAFRNPAHPGTGNRKEDSLDGCYHLDIGRPKGIVKKVSFSKNNIKYHRESRMFNQGAAGLSMLSAVYDCKVDMMGNTLFLPGMEFWLNPYGFGGEAFGMPNQAPLSSNPSPAEIIQRNTEIGNLANEKLPGESEPQISSAEKALLDRKQAMFEETGEWAQTTAELQKQEAKAKGSGQAKKKESCYISSYSNVMGIGGYQLVTKVQCKITPGEYSTSLNAKHVYTGFPGLTDYNKVFLKTGGKISDPSLDKNEGGNYCDKMIKRMDLEDTTG